MIDKKLLTKPIKLDTIKSILYSLVNNYSDNDNQNHI